MGRSAFCCGKAGAMHMPQSRSSAGWHAVALLCSAGRRGGAMPGAAQSSQTGDSLLNAAAHLLNFLASRFCISEAASVPAAKARAAAAAAAFTYTQRRSGNVHTTPECAGARGSSGTGAYASHGAGRSNCCRGGGRTRQRQSGKRKRWRLGRTRLEARRDSKAGSRHHHGACRGRVMHPRVLPRDGGRGLALSQARQGCLGSGAACQRKRRHASGGAHQRRWPRWVRRQCQERRQQPAAEGQGGGGQAAEASGSLRAAQCGGWGGGAGRWRGGLCSCRPARRTCRTSTGAKARVTTWARRAAGRRTGRASVAGRQGATAAAANMVAAAVN